MPYIEEYMRPEVDNLVALDEVPYLSEGSLNYLLTRIVLAYLGTPVSYARAMEVVGTLEMVKEEFQRRVVAPYEDMKRDLNGEVYF